MSEKRIHISLNVVVSDQIEAVRVMEVLARVAAGLSDDLTDPYLSLSVTKSEFIAVEEG